MKNIKLRAWIDTPNIRLDGERAFMTYEVNEISLKNKQIFFADCFVCNFDECKLMLLLDYHDSKGKEIWEGDIVKHEPHWADQRTISIVEDFGIRPFHIGDWGLDEEECEVIGNIFENPNLIPEE